MMVRKLKRSKQDYAAKRLREIRWVVTGHPSVIELK